MYKSGKTKCEGFGNEMCKGGGKTKCLKCWARAGLMLNSLTLLVEIFNARTPFKR